jgi:hypothetical protein
MKLHIGANSMEERMSADPELKHPLQKNKIHCIAEEDGGDGDVEIYELWLWDICLSAQRTFDAQVIFIHSPHDYSMKLDEVIKFFVPRDHPRIADLEAYLIEILDRVRKACVAAMPVVDGWCPDVDISLYRYSGINGAVAFHYAYDAVWDAGGIKDAQDFLGHPKEARTLAKLAFEEGRKAAREQGRRGLLSRLASPSRS